ncbi:MAG: hypothetical protein KDG55_02405 [Rhodocyclaceae bacterium]|nr:hypothetical protein [Rhodocyclaceae bacterium]
MQALDTQHARILVLAREALDLAIEYKVDGLHRALDLLHKRLNEHFEDEERLLQELQFEGLVDHCESHMALMERFAELLVQVATGGASTGEVVKFIEGPIKGHFGITDAPIDLFLRTATSR